MITVLWINADDIDIYQRVANSFFDMVRMHGRHVQNASPAVAGERVREAILAVFFSGAESDVRQSLVQKRPVGPSLAGGSSVSQAAPGKLGSVAS